MKTESSSKFQVWYDAELKWTRDLRRRKFMLFLKCIGITVIIALLVGIAGFFMEAGSDNDTGLIVVAAVIFSIVLVTVIVFFSMLPGFLKGSYARKIRRAMKRQGFNELQRDQFAKEQLAAQGDPDRSVSLTVDGDLPARFTLSERYVCLTGGMNYGPDIVRIDGAETVCVSVHSLNIPAISRIFGLVIQKNVEYTRYLIQFIGQGKEQGGIILSDRTSFDKVLDVLRRRFPVSVG